MRISSFWILTLASLGLLLGTPLADQQRSSAKVNYNIGPETVTNFAGYINVNKTRNLFYWFFESRNDPTNDPLILWMTGIPNFHFLLPTLALNWVNEVPEETSP